jgi:hypothetical protein
MTIKKRVVTSVFPYINADDIPYVVASGDPTFHTVWDKSGEGIATLAALVVESLETLQSP